MIWALLASSVVVFYMPNPGFKISKVSLKVNKAQLDKLLKKCHVLLHALLIALLVALFHYLCFLLLQGPISTGEGQSQHVLISSSPSSSPDTSLDT